MISASAEAPAELPITSMRLHKRPEQPAGTSIEGLLRAVDAHVAAEANALGQYEYLAGASGDPVIALVMRLVLDDEIRHHELLQRISTTLRDAVEWTSSPGALPKDTIGEPLPGTYATIARSLIDEERTGAQVLRRLAEQEEYINGGLDSLLLEMMAMDSDKHARLLQFVLRRLEARARPGPADYHA